MIVGGLVYKVGSSIYKLVKKSINSKKIKKIRKKTKSKRKSIPAVAKKIANRLKKAGNAGYVNLKQFSKKIKSKKTPTYEEKGGWRIEKDRGNHPHGGSEWKLYKPNKLKRVATLSKNGKILRK